MWLCNLDFNCVGVVCSFLYDVFIMKPLRNIYFNGPSLFGFWEGKESTDICAAITGVSATFWVSNTEECNHVLAQKIQAFVTGGVFLLYLLFIYHLLSYISFQLCVMYPMKREMRLLINEFQIKKLSL